MRLGGVINISQSVCMFPPCSQRQISAAITQIKYLGKTHIPLKKFGEGFPLCYYNCMRTSPGVGEGSQCFFSLPLVGRAFSSCTAMIMDTENKPSREAKTYFGGSGVCVVNMYSLILSNRSQLSKRQLCVCI